MPERKKNSLKRMPWWLWVAGIDLFLVAVTASKHYPLAFPGKGWLVRHFNLAVEMNAGVWWSYIGLLAIALLTYEIYSRREDPERYAWMALSIIFACLSLDELGSIHERVGDWSHLLPYGVFFAVLIVYALTVLFRDRRTRRSALFIGAGIFIFGLVALQEFIENTTVWPAWILGLRVAVEEGSELLAAFLIFCGIVPQRSRGGERSLRAIVPDPSAMENLSILIIAGWLVQTLAAMGLPSVIDITKKGNPLVWYPVTVFFILFAASLQLAGGLAKRPKTRWALAVLFLLCSVGFATDPPRLLPLVGELIPEGYQPGAFFFSLTGLLFLIGAAIPDFWASKKHHIPLLFLLPLLTVLDNRPEIEFMVAGIMALLAFLIVSRYGETAREKAKEKMAPDICWISERPPELTPLITRSDSPEMHSTSMGDRN